MDQPNLSKEVLVSNLLNLNSSESPFLVTKTDTGIKATWNLVDAKWLKIFGEAGLKEVYEITLVLHDEHNEVSYTEKTGTIEWSAGIPTVRFNISAFSGKTNKIEKKIAFGVKPNLEIGKLYQVDFNTNKIKTPILKIVENSGWKIKRSFLERLLHL